jgi:hypothetical protein
MATFFDPRHLIDEVGWQTDLDWGNLPAAMNIYPLVQGRTHAIKHLPTGE